MSVFDVKGLQAQEDALDQKINEMRNYIVSALKEFPTAARQMNTPAYIPKLFLEECKITAPDHRKACYVIATFESSDSHVPCVLVGANGQGFGFDPRKNVDKSLSMNDVAERMMERFVEFRHMDSAKQVFEFALRGMPIDVTRDIS